MTLVLTIENAQNLPEGVPTSVRLGRKGGLDIGRSANLDWTLPDPSRFISGKHCEVRFRDEAYWLYDISANGTYLNSGTSRMQSPHRLRDGDRFAIGAYVISVAIEPDEEEQGVPESVAAGAEMWTEPHEPAVASDADLWPERQPPRGAVGPEMRPAMPRPWTPASEAEVLEDKAWRMPEPAPISPPAEAAASAEPARSCDEFLRRFAAGAGISEQIFARQDGLQVAEELGRLLRMATENLTQLLSARFKAERLARVSAQTTIQAFDNNPLKFAPTPEDAMKLMFGPRTRGYLDAHRAFEGAFTDLKTHQVDTFAAMQQAVRMLVEDLDPKEIEAAAGEDRGIALFGSRKARLWDMYLARWQAKTLRHEDGLAGAFMLYFGACYDQAKEAKMH